MYLGLGLSISRPQGILNLALNYSFLTSDALPSGLSLTRASNATYFDNTGTLQTAATNEARFDHDLDGNPQGLLIEASKVNYCLHNRDLTNAAWTKTNTTALKNATGLDGVTNSASTLTATANSGTCTQAITLASGNRTFSVYLKRVTGTGTVEITMNGGTNWTNVTANVALGGWQRVQVARSTLSNPTVGIRLGTSGDEVEVDFGQLETTYMTSPIETAAATVTRAQDICTFDNINWFNATQGTFLMENKFADNAFGGTSVLFNMSNNTFNERFIFLLQGGTSPRGQILDGGSSVFLPATLGTITSDMVVSQVMGYELDNAVYRDDTENVTFTDTTAVTLPTVTQARFGSDHTNGAASSFWLREFKYFNKRFSNDYTVGLL